MDTWEKVRPVRRANGSPPETPAGLSNFEHRRAHARRPDHARRGPLLAPFATRRESPPRQSSYDEMLTDWLGGSKVLGPMYVRPIGRPGLTGAAVRIAPEATKTILDGITRATTGTTGQGDGRTTGQGDGRTTYAYAWETPPRRDQALVVKIVKIANPKHPVGHVFAEYVREVNALRHFNDSKDAGIRNLTPRLYRAGFDPRHDVFVLVEDLIDGDSVWDFMHAHKMTAPMVVKMERAVLALWMSGYLHFDLHHDNMMITPQREVRLIDFGRVVEMDASTVRTVREAVRAGDSPHAIWHDTLRAVAQHAATTRGIGAHANVALIDQAARKVDPAALEAARKSYSSPRSIAGIDTPPGRAIKSHQLRRAASLKRLIPSGRVPMSISPAAKSTVSTYHSARSRS